MLRCQQRVNLLCQPVLCSGLFVHGRISPLMLFGPGETVSVRQDSWVLGRFSRLRGNSAPGQKPEPAPAGRMLCRLSCTASCIFPARRCFSPQTVAVNFYLYPRGFMGRCAETLRGVVKIDRTKRPVLTLGEHRRHWGHKTRNAIGR